MERRSDYEAKLALSGSGTPLDIQLLDPELMAEAERRREIVLTLEQGDRFDDATVSAAAKEFGCSKRQFNRYRQRYRDSDQLTALLSQGRDGGRGKSRLPDELEEIIQQVLEEYDRNFPQALDIQIIGEIERRCDEAAASALPDATGVRSPASGTSTTKAKRRSWTFRWSAYKSITRSSMWFAPARMIVAT